MFVQQIEEVEEALRNNLFLLALTQCISLPDICGALESDNGYATGNKYRGWCRKYLEHKYLSGPTFLRISALTAEEFYYLRCSIVHQASTIHNKCMYDRIFFTHKDSNLHCNISIPNSEEYMKYISGMGPRPKTIAGSYIQLHIQIFCAEILESLRSWIEDVKGNTIVEKNYSNTFHFRPNGVKGFMEGTPLFG